MWVFECLTCKQEQYWRIPADMTPAQLDEAVQALQTDGSHDNSNTSQLEDTEPTTRELEEDDETLCSIVEEPEQQDVTPPDENTIADNNDDGAQSDSSEQSGLCIDYHSDSATEGTKCRAVFINTLYSFTKTKFELNCCVYTGCGLSTVHCAFNLYLSIFVGMYIIVQLHNNL